MAAVLAGRSEEDLSADMREAFMKLLPPGHGDTVIVKTVFEDEVFEPVDNL